MKLNKKDKDEFRNKIIEQLKEVPEGQLLQIDKEILEDLLFETITVDKEKGIQIKLPVWSGEFLSKIDLSQVDFTNVSWTLLGAYNINDAKHYKEYIKLIDYSIEFDERTRFIISKIQKEKSTHLVLQNGHPVRYDKTNAIIDLSKSFEAIQGKVLSIHGCNFTELDFSHQDLSNIERIIINDSSLSETKLPIGNKPLYAKRSYLNGIDLSAKEIKAIDYFFGNGDSLYNCYLNNCKVQITLQVIDFKTHEASIGLLRRAMKEQWVGCYVNGKKVLSQDEKVANAKKRRQEYENMRNEIISSTLENIEKQVNNIKSLRKNRNEYKASK